VFQPVPQAQQVVPAELLPDLVLADEPGGLSATAQAITSMAASPSAAPGRTRARRSSLTASTRKNPVTISIARRPVPVDRKLTCAHQPRRRLERGSSAWRSNARRVRYGPLISQQSANKAKKGNCQRKK